MKRRSDLSGNVHVAGALIDASGIDTFRFLSDPHQLKYWAAGLADQHVGNTGLITGRLVADGRQYRCKIEAYEPARLVTYHLGPNPASLTPRIVAQVMTGEVVGASAKCSYVTLLAWRDKDMDDRRWQGLQAAHETEVLVLKTLLERGA